MSARVLVAGIGNMLLGDDGFGVEVARRLSSMALPDDIEVMDAGIRGLHLAYRIADGCELLIAVDAVRRGGTPGTVYLIAPEIAEEDGAATAAAGGGGSGGGFHGSAAPDAHGMDLESVFAVVRSLGASIPHVLLVGCEPASVEERVGLSAAVARAVEPAMARILDMARLLVEGDADEVGNQFMEAGDGP